MSGPNAERSDEEEVLGICWCQGTYVYVTHEMVKQGETRECKRKMCYRGTHYRSNKLSLGGSTPR